MPICCMCREDKPPEAFAFRSLATGELQSHCRECHAAYRRQHYLDNKPVYIAREIARIKRFREQNRVLLFEYLSTHQCIDCGETDVLVLDFDHRDPATKTREVAYIAARKPWKFVEAEIAKCDVRCVNCHRRRTAEQFSWKKRDLRGRGKTLVVALPDPRTTTQTRPPSSTPVETAQCSRCLGVKSIDQFSIKNKKTGRRSRVCKACIAANSRRHYERNKETYLARGRKNKKRYRKQNRALVLDLLIGKNCVDCGESDPVVLDFDHRDPTMKADTIGRLVGSGQWNKVAAEIAKCDVRCGNCHRRRTAAQFGWTKLLLQQAAENASKLRISEDGNAA